MDSNGDETYNQPTTPLSNQSQNLNDNIICEGKAKIRNPQHVFYNPVQEFNRDITVLVASKLSRHLKQQEGVKGIRILEALAATGLRSMRFALEIPDVDSVTANDYDIKALNYIQQNAELNGVSNIVVASCADASILMHNSKHTDKRFHMVDLDPYGSASPFLDAAVQCVVDGGILCVTSTDMAVLCGNSAESCYSKYASISIRSKFCHEMALRILLRCIEGHANRYSRYITPLLSLSVDFYCRVFVKVMTSQKEVKRTVTKISHVFYCPSCSTHQLLPLCQRVPTSPTNHKFVPSSTTSVPNLCSICHSKVLMAGPIWTDALHDTTWVSSLLEDVDGRQFGTVDRMKGMLNVVKEELNDVPLYYHSDHLCSVLHSTCISFIAFRSALLNGGFRVSSSHACKNSIKTDAPAHVVWDIMRCFVRENPISINRNPEGSAAHRILSQPITFEADFTPHPLSNPQSRSKGMLRWQVNPLKNWGPKAKATRGEKETTKKKKKDKSEYMCKKAKLSNCSFGKDCVYKHED